MRSNSEAFRRGNTNASPKSSRHWKINYEIPSPILARTKTVQEYDDMHHPGANDNLTKNKLPF